MEDRSYEEGLAQLKWQCSQYSEQLKKLKSDHRTVHKQQPIENDTDIDVHKAKRLTAAIKVTKDKEITNFPTNKNIIRDFNIQNLQQHNKELEMLLEHSKSQQKHLQENVERAKCAQVELQQVQSGLKSGIEDLSSPKESSTVDQKQSLKKLNEAYDSYIKQMDSFIKRHFPPPNEEDLASLSKNKFKGAIQETRTHGTIMSLQDLLEDLIYKCTSNKHDPYIELTNEHWPPYIEMLQRHNIIQRHPTNNNAIKIVDFHAI